MRYNLHPQSSMDDPSSWSREAGYFGLGEDAGESIVLMTPSGAPAMPQAAATPSDTGTKPWYASIADAFSAALPVAASVYQQKKFTDLNIERSRAGLAPISAAQYAQQYQIPAAQVQVGPNDAAKKLMLYGGIAIGGLVLLRALKVI